MADPQIRLSFSDFSSGFCLVPGYLADKILSSLSICYGLNGLPKVLVPEELLTHLQMDNMKV